MQRIYKVCASQPANNMKRVSAEHLLRGAELGEMKWAEILLAVIIILKFSLFSSGNNKPSTSRQTYI